MQEWLGYQAPVFPGSEWIPPVLGTIIFVYGGLVFLKGARDELRNRQPGMMTLISLAIVVAFAASWAATLGIFEVDVWWELSTLITVMSLGHWIEMRSIMQAQGALSALAQLLPDAAERVTPTGTEVVPLASLAVGDVVLVRPGTRVPADGTVTEGAADVDESMITGESRPVAKQPGEQVVAGTVAAGGSLRVRVTAVGEQTALSGIMRLVAEAQASQSHAQVLADRAAALLFFVALGAGVITLVVWTALGEPEEALIRTATVLVIACPHALGLAIPLVIAISTTLGARNGLLVKDRLALERAREVKVVIFDKTGTLTRGEPVVAGIVAAPGWDEDALLALTAAVEADSEHPLARAVVRAADDRSLAPPARLCVRGARRPRRGRHRRRPAGPGRQLPPGRGAWPGPSAVCRRCRRGMVSAGPHGAFHHGGRRRARRRGAGGRDPTRVRRGGQPPARDGSAGGHDHRRRAGGRRLGGAPHRHRPDLRAGAAGRQGSRRAALPGGRRTGGDGGRRGQRCARPGPGRRGDRHRRRAPTWRSNRRASCWFAATRGTWPRPSS